MKKYKGIMVGFYTEDWLPIHEYTNLEGWPIYNKSDVELDAFYFNIEGITGPNGVVRNVGITLERDLLRKLLDKIDKKNDKL